MTIDDSRTTLLNPTVWMPSDDDDYFWRGTALLLFTTKRTRISSRSVWTKLRNILEMRTWAWFLTGAVVYWCVLATCIDSDVPSLTILCQVLAHPPYNVCSFYHVSTQFLNYNPLRRFLTSDSLFDILIARFRHSFPSSARRRLFVPTPALPHYY
jgi:hypothetical protein